MLYEPDFLKTLYIMGADPVVTFPNSSEIVSTLKSLNLLIVQDIALTETAKLAHVILPASSWAEKDGMLVNAEGFTQRVYKVTEPAGQSLPDWEIIKNLVLSMGKDLGIKNRKDIVHEIDSLSAVSRDLPPMTCTFNPVYYTPGEKPDETYPLNMVLRDVLPHEGSMSTRSKSLSLVASEARLEINGQDAERFGISNNSHVKVTSRRGTVYLRATVSHEIPNGIVYVPSHFPHSGVCTLTCTSGKGGIPMDAVRVETV